MIPFSAVQRLSISRNRHRKTQTSYTVSTRTVVPMTDCFVTFFLFFRIIDSTKWRERITECSCWRTGRNKTWFTTGNVEKQDQLFSKKSSILNVCSFAWLFRFVCILHARCSEYQFVLFRTVRLARYLHKRQPF